MNNVSLCSTKDCEKLSNVTPIIRRPTNDPITYVYFVAGSLGIVPNLIIILGVCYKKSLHKPTYYLLANLALCDMLLGASSISNAIMGTLSRQSKISHNIHAILCKIFGVFPLYLSYTASIQTLVTISAERYHAIFRPTFQLTAKKAKFLCLIAWIISLFISFPFIITSTANKKLPKQCLGFLTYTNWTTIIYLILFVFQFALPSVVIITLYSLILHQLKKSIPGRNESSRSKNLKRKTIYMLLTTTIVFLIFSGPWAVTLGIVAITGKLPGQLIFHPAYPGMREIVRISRFMLPISACYNPIVYCIFNPPIRNLYLSCCRYLICMKTGVAPTTLTNRKSDHASTATSNAGKETSNKYLKQGFANTSISHP